MDLRSIQQKGTRHVIGLMSGTSCDGIDAALVRIKGTGPSMNIKLGKFETFPYPDSLRNRLLDPRIGANQVCSLNFELGEAMAGAAETLLKGAQEDLCDVDFIATSGHTVAHLPARGGGPRGTLQIGEPAIIAERCQLPVVSDFRPRDMAAGGQGAPLVPYVDWLMFRRSDRTVAICNIGGITNVTVVPPDMKNVLAFDIGPGNMAIDGAVRLLTAGEQQMDTDGEAAARGVVIDEFLEYLLDHPYFAEVPPKSTGREEFGPEIYLRDALASRSDQSYEDLLATVTAAVAYSVVRAHNRFIKPQFEISRLVFSGGGAHNATLLKRIKEGLPEIKMRTSESYGISVDAREAVAFAILGNETICGTPSNVPSATGAHRSVVLGKIMPP